MENKKDNKKKTFSNYDSIGHYEHDINVYLHSKFALRLVGGRKGDSNAKEKWAKHEVIGLVKYAPSVIRLYKHGYNDNPYVDEALIELEEKIKKAETYLKNSISELKARIKKEESTIKLIVVQSTKPFHLKPSFGGNPYANKGVILLSLYDQLMMLMETCRSYGLISRKTANAYEYQGGKSIRRVFVFPGEFKLCDVTRDDIKNKTALGCSVIKERGLPSECVLEKRVVPEFGPVFDINESELNEFKDVIDVINNLKAT